MSICHEREVVVPVKSMFKVTELVSCAMLMYTGEQYNFFKELSLKRRSKNEVYCVDSCWFRRLPEYCWKLR